MEQNKFHVIGRIVRRKDGIAKVTGREIYSSDVTRLHIGYARVLRSPYPHARIKSIDTEAEKMGAVCFTCEDTPDIKYNECQVSIPEKTYKDRVVLPDKANVL